MVDPRPIGDRPWREVREYMVLTDYTVRDEQIKRAQAAAPPERNLQQR